MQHNELNPPLDEAVNLLQVWVMPNQQGLTPGCQKKNYSLEGKPARWCLLSSSDSEKGPLVIHQDARVCHTTGRRGSAGFSAGYRAQSFSACRVARKWIQAFSGGCADDSDEVSGNLAD